MKVKEVLQKYHALVPFPWTLAKIHRAGYDPKRFFIRMGKELSKCEDTASTLCQKVIQEVSKLDA